MSAQRATRPAPTVTILGIGVARLSRAEALERIEALVDLGRPALLAFANAHTLNLAYADDRFRDVLRSAAVVLNDGIGVTLAGVMLGSPFRENLNGSDFIPELLGLAARRGWRVYLVGGRPGVAERAARTLRARLPDLNVCGVRDGFFAASDSPAVAAAIRDARADVVVVAMGNPRQELWLAEYLEATGAAVGIGAGAFLDFQAGVVRRAPAWMNRWGVEWTFRLAQEPRRLARRYLMGNPLFLARVARQAAATEPDPTPERLNERVWSRGSFLRLYSDRTLRPPEVVLLARYRDELSGRVLELGSGGGRIAGYLLELGAEVRGIDLSEAMVEYCRRRYPRGTFDVGDLRDLAGHGDASYDAVFAGYNLLDVLDDPERRRVLGEIRRILIPDGVLIMSSHNRAYLPRVRPATRLPRARDPLRLAADLVRMPRRIYNSRRVRPLERSEERYALANDEAHDYRLLHYYIDRDEQGRQFAEVGFELVECLDGEGAIVAEGETAADSPELHYVAHATR